MRDRDGSESTVERRFSAITRRAAARKRVGLRPESESSEPREQDRDSSLTNFCVSERVVGVGRGFGIHLTNVSTASFIKAKLKTVMNPAPV